MRKPTQPESNQAGLYSARKVRDDTMKIKAFNIAPYCNVEPSEDVFKSALLAFLKLRLLIEMK